MKKRLIPLILLALLLFATACGAPEEASGPIEAVPLEDSAAAEPASDSDDADTSAAEPAEEEPAEEEEMSAEEPAEEETAAEEEAAEEEAAEEAAAGELTIFTISQESSQARFELDEDLAGARITVVGTTDQVAGEIGVDFTNPANSQLGVIQVNARTFVTDNDFRNRAIQNRILNTDTYEFITFTPAGISGLPESVAVGDTINFSVAGDLTVRDVTSTATFDVELTIVSETEISGSAGTTIMRETYELQIPSVPNVANVEEEIELYIDFTALAG